MDEISSEVPQKGKLGTVTTKTPLVKAQEHQEAQEDQEAVTAQGDQEAVKAQEDQEADRTTHK